MTIETILLATDFDESAERAFEHATSLGQKLGARLVIVHAFEVTFTGTPYGVDTMPPDVAKRIRAAAAEALDAIADRARKAGAPRVEAELREGKPWEEIDRVAEERKADLVVVGTHGRRGLSRALLGSVAEKVVRTAPCAVLTVRAGPAG